MRFFMALLVVIGVGMHFSLSAQMRDPSPNGRSGGHAVFGDIDVGGNQAGAKPIKIDLTLYTESRTIIARDTVFGNGRYRFNNVPSGIYEIAAEVEGQELTRIRVDLTSPLVSDVRRDLTFELKSTRAAASKPGAISAADQYERNPANAAAFARASAALGSAGLARAHAIAAAVM